MTKTRNKKTVVSLLLVALLSIAVIGGTLAYLSTTTADTTNAFTFVKGDEGARIELLEPGWVASKGQNLTPGSEIPKDPQIKNSGILDLFVAMQVTFTDGDGNILSGADYTRLAGLITIDYDTTKWTAAAAAGPVTVYDYTDKLTKEGGTTIPLFNKVTIKSTITNADIEWLTNTLKGFNIVVKGAGIQADQAGITLDTVKAELNGLFTAAAPTP